MDGNKEKTLGEITMIEKTETNYLINYVTGEKGKLIVLNDHVFRYQMSTTGDFLEYPKLPDTNEEAKIIENDTIDFSFLLKSQIKELHSYFIIETKDIQINFDKLNGTMTVHDKRAKKDVIIEAEPLKYYSFCTQTLHQRHDEYFFGGGMQNGRFSHKGKVIQIECTNIWTEGGVTSPCPFYWSSYGYGVLRNTWQRGLYDFGETFGEFIKTTHEETSFDAYFFINSQPNDILKDYYELTGKPILIPKFAFYPAYMNIFNRNWVEVDKNTKGAVLFGDNRYYKSYKAQNSENKNGIVNSLNGEKNNYQFSARAMIDRYRRHDIPLGWFIPNDGYDLRQGESFKVDIKELNRFVEYANDNAIEVALASETKLHNIDSLNVTENERYTRQIFASCNIVGFKFSKWIESDNSFVTRFLEETARNFTIIKKESIRPLIVTVNGWAGTQRFASIWSGNQIGGTWENIGLHIPSFIGSGLSGIPVVGSDVDGIFGGGNKDVNIREYQWKAFTPLQFNMDGWSKICKTPFSFDKKATEINRAYLKLKSILMPYNYSIAYESIDGLPMIRAMFLEYPEEISAYNEISQYQYMWGPNILVAPIYNNNIVDKDESSRDGIYLPDEKQVWIDFFTGEKYQGGKIYNNILTPLWKLPVFIKDGSIIPMTNPNNNPKGIDISERILTLFPNGEASFDVYEDDGVSLDYKEGYSAITNIYMNGPKTNVRGNLNINISATTGCYLNLYKDRSTIIKIMASSDVESLEVFVNCKPISMTKLSSLEGFFSYENCYCFDEKHVINPFLLKYQEIVQQKFLVIKIGSLNVTDSTITIRITGFVNYSKIIGNYSEDDTLRPPSYFEIDNNKSNSSNVSLKWIYDTNADCYEIERDGVVYTNIKEKVCTYENFMNHRFRVRAVLNGSFSNWSKEIYNKNSMPISNVKITCNIPSQPGQEIHHLTDGDCQSLWHTDWSENGKANGKNGKFLKLSIDLGEVYELDRITYLPREDAWNGLFLKVQYRYSLDNNIWSPLSKILHFPQNNITKTIKLNGRKMRYVELKVLKSVNDFGSGKQMSFYQIISKIKAEEIGQEISGLSITCNLLSQPGCEIDHLTDGNLETLWQTKFGEEGKADPENDKFVTLLCDLGATYNVDKVTYLPVESACNGTFLEIQFRYSLDNLTWNSISPLTLAHDNTLKILKLNGIKLRYLEITALKTVGNYGSGRQIKLYEKK